MWTMQCLWDDERATTWIAAATMANNIRPLVIYRYSCARHECRARVIRYIAEVKTTANSSDNGDRRYWSMTLERTSTYCFSRWNWFDYSVPAIGERSIVMSLSVCLCVCVCVCVCLSACPKLQVLPLPMTMSQSCCGGVAIFYVLPVLWMTSCLHIIVRNI